MVSSNNDCIRRRREMIILVGGMRFRPRLGIMLPNVDEYAEVISSYHLLPATCYLRSDLMP